MLTLFWLCLSLHWVETDSHLRRPAAAAHPLCCVGAGSQPGVPGRQSGGEGVLDQRPERRHHSSQKQDPGRGEAAAAAAAASESRLREHCDVIPAAGVTDRWLQPVGSVLTHAASSCSQLRDEHQEMLFAAHQMKCSQLLFFIPEWWFVVVQRYNSQVLL